MKNKVMMLLCQLGLSARMRAKFQVFCLGAAMVMSMFGVSEASAQELENVEVETYYITNENDVASPGLSNLPLGTTVYRVFIDLCEGCKLKSIFGDTNHELRIQSTAPILNSQFGSSFAHNISGSLFSVIENSALDSYFSMGAASNGAFGIPKQDDPDGSIWQSRTAPQPLTNDAISLGIPLTTSDGLVSSQGASTLPPGWSAPANLSEINAVLGTVNNGLTEFISNNTNILSFSGVQGTLPENKILIAQITSEGELSFNLNLVIIKPDGNEIRVVGSEPTQPGEILSPLLSYPPTCGCTDPDFLEFDLGATCDDGSCLTLIVFGCLNEEACNFSTTANFNVPELCCFPDSCQGLDISILCPFVSANDAFKSDDLKLYPNPTNGMLSIEFASLVLNQVRVSVFDLTGRMLLNDQFVANNYGTVQLNLNQLHSGTYIVHITDQSRRFVRLVEKID